MCVGRGGEWRIQVVHGLQRAPGGLLFRECGRSGPSGARWKGGGSEENVARGLGEGIRSGGSWSVFLPR